MLRERSNSYARGSGPVLVTGIKERELELGMTMSAPSLRISRNAYENNTKPKADIPVLPCSNNDLTSNAHNFDQILTSQLVPHIATQPRSGLLLVLLLALECIETDGLVGAQRIDVSGWVQKACVCDCRSVVDDLVQGVLFLRRRSVEEVD
jgi:hypothetical protein